MIRGPRQPGGQERVFLNLRSGLDRLGISYSVNDYQYAKKNRAALACIVGKPCVLNAMSWKNPIMFGASGYSHPIDDPTLLDRLPIKRVLVPGPWMEEMCRPCWGDAVKAWPVGIDTDLWHAPAQEARQVDVLLYDKVRWKHDQLENSLIIPIRSLLQNRGHSVLEMRYGFYREDDFYAALSRCRTMVFLCEHESQGIAYQQALSCNVPILAWDRGGYWEDPNYSPHIVNFQPVTSVPYWDERCGRKFRDAAAFGEIWPSFWEEIRAQLFSPRDYIMENLTLEKCAMDYCALAEEVSG